MPLALAPGMSFCVVDGSRIFLDRNRDRYFALGPKADAIFDRALNGHRHSIDLDPDVTILTDSGILVDDPSGNAPRPCPALPVVSSPLDDDPQLRAVALATLKGALAIRLAQAALRRQGFARLCRGVESARARTRNAERIPPSQQRTIAGNFAAAGRLAGAFEQCLPLSIAMIRYCRRRGYQADFVIGVKTRPFQAHAWVASAGVVLSDRAATARLFTPILIL